MQRLGQSESRAKTTDKKVNSDPLAHFAGQDRPPLRSVKTYP